MSTLTVAINGTSRPVLDQTFEFVARIDEHSTCKFTVKDPTGVLSFQKWQPVTVTDSDAGLLFSGFIWDVQTDDFPPGAYLEHTIDCVDNHAIAAKRTTNKKYESQYAGVIVADMAKSLAAEGVTANYAIRFDDTEADFVAGTLTDTTAVNDTGGLELASAGSLVTVTESTTSHFGTGTLTGVTAANNTLAPTSFKAIKMQCTNTGIAIANTYTYVKIFSPSGTFTVVATRYLFYQIWVDPASPEIKFGVDIVFTDGTTLRDNFTDKELSQNNLSPHPDTSLKGYADGKWYGRTFSLASFTGKNIAYIAIACEGNEPGVYTAYFQNIIYLNGDFSFNQAFFSTSLNVNPPQQLQNQGFATTTVKVVDAYDCLSANRVSGSTSISGAGILKRTFLTWKETLPEHTDLTVEYSLDGGNSYIECTNNAPLPSLPAGLSLASKSIKFRETFTQLEGASPESKPILSYLQLLVHPSYTDTKSDVTYSASTTSEWNSSSTHTDTQAVNNLLQLIGYQRYFDNNTTDNEMSGITLFGGGATGPDTATSCRDWIEKKQYRLFVYNNTGGWGRMTDAGTFADGILEFDVYIDNSLMKPGCMYRTNSTSNYAARYAYAVEIFGTTIKLQRGENNNTASDGVRTEIGTATVTLTSQAIHRIKVEFVGSSHKVYLNDNKVIDVTDGTFTAAGYCFFRVANGDASNGYIALFDNFGIVKSLTGNWLGTSTSLTGAGTYLGSVVTWDEVSLDEQSTNVLVESTINGGSSYQTVTNGGAIPNLTAGQSLSGISVRFRITLTTATATSMPQVRYFVCRVLGGFSSSGTRVSPALSLAAALIAGSTLVAWNADVPAGTTVAVETSPTGSGSWTSVTSGGEIAGITGQPLPTLDTFDTDTSANYTSTARTGGTNGTWVYSTPNSRISVSGGTNAIFLLNAITAAPVDVTFDLDQSDAAGIVWRHTSASNFYELEIFDASSSAGATNVMRLYKVVSNVKTQIGTDISILFTRNTPRRVRVKMVGTAIDIYFDGDLVRSTTDSGLTAAGKVGLFEATDVGRFYNFRIQPIGDDLAGKSAYTRVTLTSTDPTVTPQMTDLVLAALHPNIAKGALVPVAEYLRTHITDNMDDLSEISDTYWQIDQIKSLFFTARTALPAPWILNSDDVQIEGLEVENSADLYRNREIITGVVDTKTVSVTEIGDGETRSWTLGYPLADTPTILLNNQPQTVGLKGDAGYDFYWAPDDATITQDDSEDLLVETDTLAITYLGKYETEVIRNNTGGFPGTTTQADFKTLSGLTGGDGVVEHVTDVSGKEITVDGAEQLGDSLLQRFGVIGKTLRFHTRRQGLLPGQYLPVFFAARGFNDDAMLITETALRQFLSVDSGSNEKQEYRWVCEAVEGPSLGSWHKSLSKMLK